MGIAENLGLDRGLLERAADVYEGYAYLNDRQSKEENLFIRASCLAVAASYLLVIDTKRAIEVLAEAASAYQMLNIFPDDARDRELPRPRYEPTMPFDVPLAVCANQLGMVEKRCRHWLEARFDEQNPEIVFYQLLAFTAVSLGQRQDLASQVLFRLMDYGSRYRFHGVGRLGLPLGVYYDFAGATKEVKGAGDIDSIIDRVMGPFLSRLDEAVEGAVSNRYQWSRLQSGILPIEPEALAICVLMNQLTLRNSQGNRNLGDLLGEKVPLRSSAYALVAVELSQAQSFG